MKVQNGNSGIAQLFLQPRKPFGQHHASALISPGKIPDTNFAGGWGGPQGRSERVRKISPVPGFDPPTVQPVASGCTD